MSVNRLKILTFCICVCFLLPSLQAQFVYTLDPVVITASRLSCVLVSDMREILVLSKEEIGALPVESVSELLQYIGGVDLQCRGIGGIQADFSLRGCSFEQVIVLVDGVRMNDPQTGHHNGDIPLTISDIERIEVLSGHGSSMYGPDGFGGIIHILTKIPQTNHSQISVKGGSYGTILGSFSQSLLWGSMQNRISLEKKQSDGHRFDTDYNVTTASYRSTMYLAGNEIDWSLGYTSKDFGANGFYADFPSREKTDSYDAHVGLVWQSGSFLKVRSRIFRRQHDDAFTLDFQHPQIYQANHRTVVWGGEIQTNMHFSEDKEFALGVETSRETIKSSHLGNRGRYRTGLFGEMVYPLSRNLSIDGSMRTDYQKGWGIQVNPSVSLRYEFVSGIQWRFSTGRVFRAPTFTELYYYSPTDNIGNPRLKPEVGWSWETGFSLRQEMRSAEMTFFLRNERNRIDWIKWKRKDPWQATNIGTTRIVGVSVVVSGAVSKQFRMRCHYTGISREKGGKKNYFSKYAFHAPIHHLVFIGFSEWPWKVKQSVMFILKKRETASVYGVLAYKCSYPWWNMLFFLELTNVLDVKYEEIPGIPMPGRKMMIGVQFDGKI